MTRFLAGRGIALVTESTMFLLDASSGPLAEKAWALMDHGAGAEALLELISGTGLRTLGSFALVQIESDDPEGAVTDEERPRPVRLVVRGTATIEIGAPGVTRTFAAGGVRTWLEDVVAVDGSIELRLEGASAADVPFRVTSGIVAATALCRTLEDAGPSLVDIDIPDPSDSDAWWETPAEPPPATLEAPQSIERTPGEPISADAGTARSSAPAAAEPVPNARQSPATNGASAPGPGLDPGRTITTDDLASRPTGGSSLPADDDYDAIYGRTIMRSVQDAAVAPPDPADLASPADAQNPITAPTGMIDGIPGAEPDGAGQAGDHDGRTISKAQAIALRTAAQRAPAASTGPVVQAVECPAGHPNPPQLVLCRRCGQAIRAAAHVLVARPVLGRVRFSTGEELDLERPVLIGRNPRIEGQIINELPHMVRLDIGQGLSRTHAAIRLEGWQVYVEDLNSANGTVLTLPGRAPRRLHAGEPALLEHGALLDLGGEVTCTYEEIP